MNAKVDREECFRPTIGKYSLHEETNENGLRLIDFAAEKGLVVKSTFFMHKRIHQATWNSPDEITRNQIDHCLIDGRHFSDVINVKSCRGVNVDSDHFCVLVVVRIRLARAHSIKYQTAKKFAVDKLKNPEVSATFARGLSTRVNQLNIEANDPPMWSYLSQIIKEEEI